MHPYGKEELVHIKLHLLTVLFCILDKSAKLVLNAICTEQIPIM